MQKFANYMWGLLRLSMGWLLLWAFLDKLFGLGFATESANAWLKGGSPTTGFLKFGTTGPFTDFFQGLAGNTTVDWIFMLALGLGGVALVLGIGVRIASYGGALLMAILYLAGSLPGENNPFLDEHIVYIIVFLGLASSQAGSYIGLGKWWSKSALVKKIPILE